jgi:hypothetical protein
MAKPEKKQQGVSNEIYIGNRIVIIIGRSNIKEKLSSWRTIKHNIINSTISKGLISFYPPAK